MALLLQSPAQLLKAVHTLFIFPGSLSTRRQVIFVAEFLYATMRLHLVDLDEPLVNAWVDAFSGFPEGKIYCSVGSGKQAGG